jgi:integrase
MHILSTAEEIDYFQRAARFPDLHDAGQLMINLGLSETEAVALAKAHVDLAGSGLRIRSAEGNPERVLPVTAGCSQILIRRMGGDSRWIFPSKRNSAEHILRVDAAHRSVVAEAAREGIIFDFILHDLRLTCLRRMSDILADRRELAPHDMIRHWLTRYAACGRSLTDRSLKQQQSKSKGDESR